VNGSRAGEWVALPSPPSSWIAGRSEEADLFIDDADVSREHSEIIHDLEGVVIRDLGSKNGILVGGRNVRTRRLVHGDEVTLGATIMRFEDPASASLETMLAEDDAALNELPVGPSSPSAVRPLDSGNELDEVAPEEDDAEGAIKTETPAASEPTGDTSRASELPAAPTSGGADVAIYALAGTVLALSLAGLYWLFTSH
jgi:hypothetical protein